MKIAASIAWLLLAAPASAAANTETVVLMPVTNLSGAERAPAEIGVAFGRVLAAKGYTIAPSEGVEGFLAAERIRYLDSLPSGLREKLLAKLSASAIVFGTVYDFAEGDNAIVGISARMLRVDGSVQWAGVAGISTEDTEGAFGLHRTNDTRVLAEEAMERLVRDLPAPGSPPVRLASARAKPLVGARPVTFRSVVLEPGREHRICLLPLENRTSVRLASRVVAELLAQRLEASGTFRVVEPADFREAMVAGGVRGLRSGDPAELAKLSKSLGTSLFLRGTIYAFRDASSRNASVTPELEIDLALVDAAAGKVVWTSRIARQGRDYEGFLERGAITNIVTLTDQVTSEIVRAVEGAKGQGRWWVSPIVTASDKTYDGSAAATITSCSLSGVLSGDETGVSCSVASASFPDANAGDGKTVTAVGLALTGSASTRYRLEATTAAATASIRRRPVTAVVAASGKTYDGTTSATISSCTPSGLLPADSRGVGCKVGNASFADPNAGAGKTVTASEIALGGGASGNYALSSTTASTTADIARKPVTAALTASDKIYDGTNAAGIESCALSEVIGADSADVGCAAASATFADRNAGTGKTVTAAGIGLSGAASGNYTLTSTTATGKADIAPKPLTASITASPKIYDGTAAARIANCELTGVIAADSNDVSCLASGGTFSDKHAGHEKTVTASADLSGSASRNYVLASKLATTTGDIEVRTVTASGVVADDKIYDGTTTARLDIGGATLVDAVSGDDVAFDATHAAARFADANVGASKPVAVSGLGIRGADAANYLLTQPTVSAGITPRPVEARLAAKNKVYDGTTAAEISLLSPAGLLVSDAGKVTLVVTAAQFETKNVGTGRVVTASGLSLLGAASGNYALSSSSAVTKANIAPRRVTGRFTVSDKEYDGSVSATVLTRSLDGVVAGDDVRLSGGMAAFRDGRVGTAKIVRLMGARLSGTDAGNYFLDGVSAARASIAARAPRRIP